MARWRYSTRWRACSRNRKRFGARRTSIACRASRSSTRWTASARISTIRSARCASGFRRIPCRSPIPSAAKTISSAIIDFIEERAIIWKDETLGAEYEVLPLEKLWDAAYLETHPALETAVKASALTPEFYKEHREKVVEYIAEHDDAILTKYLEQHKLEPAELRASLRRSTIALKLVPVMAGSAFKNKGVQPLLDAVVDYLPSPMDVPPVEGTTTGRDRAGTAARVGRSAVRGAGVQDHDRPVRRAPDVHPRLFRRAEDRAIVYNSTRKTRERMGRLLRMHANKREEIESIEAGDIAACVGLKNVTTGDTLCDEEKPIVLENIDFPTPVISVAIEPKTKADQEKMGTALGKAGAGRSHVPRAHRSRYRPDADFRNGRAAPGNYRRPHDARVQRAGERGPAAGGVSRNDFEDGRRRSRSTSSRPAGAGNTAT